MSDKQIKIVSILFGILSLAFAIYAFSIYKYFFFSFGYPTISIKDMNFILLNFALTPVLFVLAAISSIGLFKLMRWGRILANISLFTYLILFSVLLITQFFPTYFENSAKSGSWFIFYHLNLRIDTFLVPIMALAFLIIFNLKIFNRNI